MSRTRRPQQPPYEPSSEVVPEEWLSPRAIKVALSVARVALFDETIDYYLYGYCSLGEAVEQYLLDATLSGIGYPIDSLQESAIPACSS